MSTPYLPSWNRSALRSLVIVGISAAVWVTAATLGHLTSSASLGLAAIYLPVALLVGFMIRMPQYRVQFAIAVLVGNLTIHVVSGNALLTPALSTAATLTEALIVSSVMRSTRTARFVRPRDAVVFGFTALGACIIGGLMGAAVYAATGTGPALHKFATWVPADLLGMLLVTPLIVKFHPHQVDRRRLGGFLGMLVIASALAVVAAAWPAAGVWGTFLSWYVVLLVLLVVGARYGVAALGVVQAVPAILVFIAIADTSPAQWFERQVVAIALAWSLLIAVLAIRSEVRSRHSSERLAAELFHHSPTPTAVVSSGPDHTTLTQTNEAWRAAFGVDDDVMELLGDRTWLPREGAGTREVHTRDGRVLAVTINSILRTTGAAQRYLISAADITDRREREAKMRLAARTDPLTGLANRRAVFKALTDRDPATTTALLYVDLDGFKDINDTYGHPVGDALLVEVAQRLAAGFRAHDVVGRIGGDEFVVIADLRDDTDLSAMGRRAEAMVTGRVEVGALSLEVRASVGAVLIAAGEAPDHTLARADAAMYRRKLQQREH